MGRLFYYFHIISLYIFLETYSTIKAAPSNLPESVNGNVGFLRLGSLNTHQKGLGQNQYLNF